MNALRNFRGVKTTPTKYFNQFNHKPDLVVVGGKEISFAGYVKETDL